MIHGRGLGRNLLRMASSSVTYFHIDADGYFNQAQIHPGFDGRVTDCQLLFLLQCVDHDSDGLDRLVGSCGDGGFANLLKSVHHRSLDCEATSTVTCPASVNAFVTLAVRSLNMHVVPRFVTATDYCPDSVQVWWAYIQSFQRG